jgi:hypothetical protein
MPTVFINYRREESAGEARALFKDMVAQLGDDAVFMDVDSIAPGLDFRDVVQQRLASCDLMLALVGKEWLTVTTRDGRRRIDDPGDFVRLEIEGALKRKIPLAPVLLHGAQMPSPDSLPESLRDFAFRNAFELSHTRWESDVDEMLRRLKLDGGREDSAGRRSAVPASPSRDSAPARSLGPFPILVLLAVLVAGGIGAYLYFDSGSPTTAETAAAVATDDVPAEQPPDPVITQETPTVDGSGEASAADTPEAPSSTGDQASDPAPSRADVDPTAAPFRGGSPPVGQRLELATQIGGADMCAERMAIRPCANRPAQRWTFAKADADNRVRIHNGAAGPNMCLDVVNDGSNSVLTFARCGEFTGQSWSVTPAGQAARFFQLRNEFSGRGRCLAAVDQPDGTSQIRMAQCAATPAQRWRLTPR